MTPRELRRAMRERRRALRRSMVLMRREARARMGQVPAVRRERTRRRIRRAATLALLLLLALFLRCECQTPPPPVPVEPPAANVEKPEAKPKPPTPKKPSKPGPVQAGLESQRRGAYQNDGQTSLAWLDDFRLQVAARSPRLAQCFTGADRPGALRWTAAVNAEAGTVSDHGLEPVGVGSDLGTKQRECVLEVLSKPAYRLKSAQAQGLPGRVSIVIEF